MYRRDRLVEHVEDVELVERSHILQRAGERTMQGVEGLWTACELVLRRRKDCGGAVGMKPDSEDGDVSSRPQQQLLRQLAGEYHRGLEVGRAVGPEPVERLSKMDDQLWPAIGKYWFGGGIR